MILSRSYPLDHFDPARLFWSLFPEGPGFFDSASRAARTGKFSIVPLRCRESYRLDEAGLHCRHKGKETTWTGDPFRRLEEILNARRLQKTAETPFAGGFFGFLAYDLAWWIENLPRRAARDFPAPALWLTWVERCAVYDHDARLLHLASIDGSDPADWQEPVLQALAADFPQGKFTAGPARPDLSIERFTEMVRRAKAYIAAGDIYQANLSCRFESACRGASSTLYRRLREVNPSPFACYVQAPGIEIISSSPERLVSLRGACAETRPIAGTRRRGVSRSQDRELGDELLAHPKERAEHVMLIDLERNDLGKVCRAGSVQVDELMVLERYSHVTHIVSNVRGELEPVYGPFALLRAMFPGGTITGVPKKRCMEIIEELEPTGRATYTGSAGYVSVTGETDFNILIRSFQRSGERLTFQAGAGIVADSDPDHEWQECIAKGAAMQKALEVIE